jgi:DNA-binding transcriptional MocR family regulator
LAEFFNAQFQPIIPVKPDHIITASGAGNALGALARTICDPGDVVFVIGPCWGTDASFFMLPLFGTDFD